jgi:hypothetical protein
MTRSGERNEGFIDGSVLGDGSLAGIFWALHLAAVRLLGVHASSGGVTPAARFGRSLSLPP